MDTDDLRESPNVELAEILARQGLRRPDLRPGRQARAASSARTCATSSEAAPPAAAARRSAGEALAGADVAIVLFAGPRGRRRGWSPPRRHLVVDLNGRLGATGRERARLLREWAGEARLRRRSARADRASSSSSRTCRCPSTGGSGWSARRSPTPATRSRSCARRARATRRSRSSTACTSVQVPAVRARRLGACAGIWSSTRGRSSPRRG